MKKILPHLLLALFMVCGFTACGSVDYLAAGDSLDTFLDDFPSVRRATRLRRVAPWPRRRSAGHSFPRNPATAQSLGARAS